MEEGARQGGRGPGRAAWTRKPWRGLAFMGIADGTPRGSDKVRSGFSESLSLQGRKERAWREAGGEAGGEAGSLGRGAGFEPGGQREWRE